MLGFSGKSSCSPQSTEISFYLLSYCSYLLSFIFYLFYFIFLFFLCLNRKFEVKLIVIIDETNIGCRKTDLRGFWHVYGICITGLLLQQGYEQQK